MWTGLTCMDHPGPPWGVCRAVPLPLLFTGTRPHVPPFWTALLEELLDCFNSKTVFGYCNWNNVIWEY